MEFINIEIEGNITPEIQNSFFNEFKNRLTQELLKNTIDDSIKRSITSILYKKPTDIFIDKCTRIKKNEEDKVCSICLNNFKKNELKRTLHCNHEYHKKCIDKWINKNNNSCPTCRSDPFLKVHQQIFSQNLHQ
jgi:hypothetical protein